MKITLIIVRTLMGLMFLLGFVIYLKTWPPEATGAMKTFNDGLVASVYIMPVVKGIELLCGLAFVSGFFVPLAAVLISPIIVNIILVHAFLSPKELPIAVLLGLANLFIAFYYRDRYKALFKP
jgi:putative oxidoreductase